MARRLRELLFTATCAAALLAAGQALIAQATQLTIPHTFEAHKTLPASWLNDNNAAIKAVVNALGSDNYSDLSVKTADLANAPDGVTTGKLNDSSVTGPKIVDGTITKAKLEAGAAFRGGNRANVTTSLNVSDGSEVTLASVSVTVSGGLVLVVPRTTLRIFNGTGGSSALTFRFKRDGVTQFTAIANSVGNGEYWITPPTWDEQPAAGTYSYSVTAQAGGAGTFPSITTFSSNAGELRVIELS